MRKTFWIFGRPSEAVRADDRVSRRDELIATGRVRPRSAPLGLDLRFWGKASLQSSVSEFPVEDKPLGGPLDSPWSKMPPNELQASRASRATG